MSLNVYVVNKVFFLYRTDSLMINGDGIPRKYEEEYEKCILKKKKHIKNVE